MKIVELFDESTMNLNLQGRTKDEVIDEMIEILDKGGVLKNKEGYKKAVYEREEISSTGLGFGIAIPHAKTLAVKTARVAFGRSEKGFDFESEDGKPAHLIFMIAVTDHDSNLHLKALAVLSRKLIQASFREKLLEAKTTAEVMKILGEISSK